jgi:Asp/Glu/hydantoin racemase
MSTRPIRIAWQSSKPVHNFPAYVNALNAHARDIVSPGTTVEMRGVRFGPKNIDYRSFDFLNNAQLFESVVSAEREGFDAVAIGCMFDPVLEELREVVDIPVLSFAETGMLTACTLGKRFGVLTHSEPIISKYVEGLVEKYGLKERAGPLVNFELSFEALEDAMAGRPEECLRLTREAGEKAVAGGAEVIIMGCGLLNLIAMRNGLHRIAGATVLDVSGALMKSAEMMVTLQRVSKVGVSRVGLYARPPQAQIDEAYRMYGLLQGQDGQRKSA